MPALPLEGNRITGPGTAHSERPGPFPSLLSGRKACSVMGEPLFSGPRGATSPPPLVPGSYLGFSASPGAVRVHPRCHSGSLSLWGHLSARFPGQVSLL